MCGYDTPADPGDKTLDSKVMTLAQSQSRHLKAQSSVLPVPQRDCVPARFSSRRSLLSSAQDTFAWWFSAAEALAPLQLRSPLCQIVLLDSFTSLVGKHPYRPLERQISRGKTGVFSPT